MYIRQNFDLIKGESQKFLGKDFSMRVYIRVLLRILMFRVKMWLCKKPFGNHILIIFTLKKVFFSHLTK